MRYSEKFTLTEINNMEPWEKEVYMNLLVQRVEEENERIKEQQHGR